MLEPVFQRRLEAAALLVFALALYNQFGFAWSTFALCFFLPDLSMLCYAINPRVGGRAYNLAHFFLFPIALGAWGVFAESAPATQAALIWGAHVAFDRAIGWGLKYEQSFCHTDMGEKKPFGGPRWLGPEPEGR